MSLAICSQTTAWVFAADEDCKDGKPATTPVGDTRGPRTFSKIPKSIQLYFATSRYNAGSRSDPSYNGSRHFDLGFGSLEYGTATLRTPQNLISPNRALSGLQFRDLMKADTDVWRVAKRNFIGCFSEDDLIEKVRKCSGKICIYIHGYDKTFDEALQDTAMLAADYGQFVEEGKSFMPILFSWPSSGERSRYAEDEANVEWSQQLFDHLLDRVIKEKSADCSVDVVAHSMGNRLIFSYLTEEHPELSKPLLNNLFLCSGDVDFHAVEAAREKIENAVSGMVYIFVSDRDRPLIMSQYMHGSPRLGRPMDPPSSTPQQNSSTAKTSDNKPTSLTDKFMNGDFWKQLSLDAAELLMAPSFTDTPDVATWLNKNPQLDREFGTKSRLLDVSELSIANMGHALAWPIVSSIMAGYLDFPQLRGRPVHKRPDAKFLDQCGGKPIFLYRYIRFEP